MVGVLYCTVHETPTRMKTFYVLLLLVFINDCSVTSTASTTAVTDISDCKDKLSFCADFTKDVCWGAFSTWAKEYCPVFCELCPGQIGTPTAVSCHDAGGALCHAVDDICTNLAYRLWAETNCQLTCNTCPDRTNGIASTASTTAVQAINGCKDKLPNCEVFTKDSCSGLFSAWAKENCPFYCELCPGQIGTPTAASCHDVGGSLCKVKDDICTNLAYKLWAETNCQLTCNTCPDRYSSVTSTTSTTAVPSINGCKDKLPNCDTLLTKDSCSGVFHTWALENCPFYCQLCPGQVGTPAAVSCRDDGGVLCQAVDDICTKYKLFAETHCQVTCYTCPDQANQDSLTKSSNTERHLKRPETTEELEMPDKRENTDMPDIFTSMVLDSCPVLTGVLQEHFQGFPEGEYRDSINMTGFDEDAKKFIATIIKMSEVLTRKRVARDAARDLANYILKKRANCPTTKLQKAFLYIYMKNLEFLTSKNKGSLLLGLMDAVKDVPLPEEAKRRLLTTLIWTLNKVIYGDLMEEEEMDEFRDVNVFVNRFRRATSKMVKSKNDATKLFKTLMFLKNKYSRVFKCTPIGEIMKLHRKGSQNLRQRLETEEFLGGVLKHVDKVLTEAFTTLLPGQDVGQVISRIRNIVNLYISGVAKETAAYENSIATQTFSAKTSRNLLHLLDERQRTYLLRLLSHLGFTVNQSPPERRYFNHLTQKRYDDAVYP